MPKTILFIEDESALQKTIGDFLHADGYEVIHALDGEIGLKIAKEKNPDLILLDLILPKVKGLDVLKMLKENNQTKDIPVIIMSNLDDMASVEKAIELGARAYLVKAQYSLEELANKIKTIFSE